MNIADVRKLSELRSVLDGFAARHAAMNAAAAPASLKQLRVLLCRVTQALRQRDYAAFRRADRELHECIIELSGVPLLHETWRRIWDSMLAFHRQGFDDYFPDARVLADEHEHLVETIALGDPAAAEDAARSHVEAVWFRISESVPHAPEPTGDPLQRAAAHLAFRLHCPLKLTEVAREIAFTSPGNLSRLFRRRHGLSFQAYLQKLRMEKAAELLSHTRLPVSRIARRVGYRDVSRFGQHFKRAFDATPVEHRTARRG
ncbi:FCD domain-containing protein [Prosthecobacter vanneervenii]|uniref:AraC-like DNA-binding protein n=1 Tax=Prosthecobacter vanneervenii TaxID=48466 RepID=A0A7W8DM37_9BACT|nr:FCD domain-containing protein [Prosthecobacter vanneervenii]MBB5034670.1 AraC-like DNA-binding protein [Prosthecobacter vanneervenii]